MSSTGESQLVRDGYTGSVEDDGDYRRKVICKVTTSHVTLSHRGQWSGGGCLPCGLGSFWYWDQT